MTKKNDRMKETPLQEKPEANPLEKEIEEMIDREKTKRRIVGKLLKSTEFKKNRNQIIKQ